MNPSNYWFSAMSSFSKFVTLVRAMRDWLPGDRPFLIHCSSGEGRTGAFIFIYIFCIIISGGIPQDVSFADPRRVSNLIKRAHSLYRLSLSLSLSPNNQSNKIPGIIL
ncbi:hypothetical protein Ciccas_007790 [Cichlidogyrus casuarinus]|uniref:Tyrosine specific protein phosphatases domain-containing protein n=1 Tax=Cichlidogyrus casuarinus TaxID=1844966 RepID=A0ABD2Q2J2_9PLAT